MELNQKLQELRKQKGMTQEELAARLFVSRTAISKWESGRGVPSIESLKQIAQFFSVTVDDLLSSDEVLMLAQARQKQTERGFRDLIFGLLDVSMLLLLFLPLFASKADGLVRSASLLTLTEVEQYLKISYLAVVVAMAVTGVLTLALQGLKSARWTSAKAVLSLTLGIVAVLLLVISQQPYAAVFAFSMLAIKVAVLLKRQ